MSIPIHTTRRVSLPCGDIVVTAGREEYRAVIPSTLISANNIGEISDQYRMAEYKTNPKSLFLDGTPFYVFGETVLKTADGDPVDTLNNSSATVLDADKSPLQVAHVPNGLPVPIIPLSKGEREFEARSDSKVILTPEGGLCETTPPGKGWLWYNKVIEQENDEGGMERIFYGTGIIPVKIDRETGKLISERIRGGAVIFDHREPAFGTFCAVREANWFYLWGRLEEDIYLARVGIWHAIQPELYEFWDGESFSQEKEGMIPVLSGISHGSFFKTDIFGHCYSWAFIGAIQSTNPKIVIGYAKDVAGPYNITKILDPADVHPTYLGNTCVYAHPWVFKEKDGELMITWYEDTLNTVLAIKLRFKMLHHGAYWKDISLKELPATLTELVRERTAMVKAIAQVSNVHYEIEPDNGTVTIKLLAHTRPELDQAVKNLIQLIESWYKEITKGCAAEDLLADGLILEMPSLRAALRRQAKGLWERAKRHSRKKSEAEI
ncbi:hypothetical protein LOZ25_006856 [Ophidiomyces ophidiicola]|nr:hypothetical protein LOZ25_006856 [Ophidiomyces ophidiicola]